MTLKNIFTLLLLLLTIALFSQTVNYEQLEKRERIAYLKGSDKPFTGKAFAYYSNGKKKKEVNFINGLKEGVYMTWYENGNKKSVKFYKNNKLDGAIITWYENGQYERKVEFLQNKKHGDFESFYDNGQQKATGKYINNKKTGIHIGYYENGNKESYGNYVDGAEDGIHTEWYENGTKCKEITYNNGEVVKERHWDETGKELSPEEIQALKQQQQNGNLMQMWLQQQ